jgi:hypothetical protein
MLFMRQTVVEPVTRMRIVDQRKPVVIFVTAPARNLQHCPQRGYAEG